MAPKIKKVEFHMDDDSSYELSREELIETLNDITLTVHQMLNLPKGVSEYLMKKYFEPKEDL